MLWVFRMYLDLERIDMTITLTREEAADVLYALADAAGCVQQNYQPSHLGYGWNKEIELLRAAFAKATGEQQ